MLRRIALGLLPIPHLVEAGRICPLQDFHCLAEDPARVAGAGVSVSAPPDQLEVTILTDSDSPETQRLVSAMSDDAVQVSQRSDLQSTDLTDWLMTDIAHKIRIG